MDLVNKVAIITGSAQGLGKAFAARLLEVGVKVCISDVNQEKGEAALTELRERFGQDKVCFFKCDVTKDEEFEKLFDEAEEFFKVDCVDILANNAGINTNFGWRKCMEVNIMSVMAGTYIAVERMKKAGKPGQIINTASLAGFGPGVNVEMTPYTVSKHGVVALTRTMAKGDDGIVHKAICPAWTDTNIVSSATSDQGSKAALMRQRHIQKMGGMMTPEHVAEGFFRLVTQCGNGTAMVVLKDTPYIAMPDYGVPMVMIIALMSRLLEKLINPQVVMTQHLVVGFTTFLLLLAYFLTILF